MALTATPRRLVQALLTASMTSRFNNTTGQKQVIKEYCFCNRTTAKHTFSLAIVPTGETLGDQHYILSDVELDGNETKWFTEISQVMELNDSIYAIASGNVTLYISAAEFTTVV
jgi:hypothetical protein